MRNKKNRKVFLVITLLAFIWEMYTQVAWIYVSASGSSQENKVEEFLDYFPSFLKSIAGVTYATLLTAVIAIIFSVLWMNRDDGTRKAFAIIILVLSCLVLLLTLFQLM